MIYVKKHVTRDRRLVLAVCDMELVGKVFSDGKAVIDVKESFYKGEQAEKEELKSLMQKAYIINLVGEKSLAVAKELNLVDSVLYVKSVPHAQVLCEE